MPRPRTSPRTLHSTALERAGVPHLFTTRRGPGGRRLDLTRVGDAERADLHELRDAGPRELDFVHQVHGAHVVEVGPSGVASSTEADGLVTDQPDRALLVRAADCVPVLLASAYGTRVATVHAGWRGLVAGVIPRALEVLGASDAIAAVGPCLRPEHFEVGEDVAESFRAADLSAAVHSSPGHRPHVDLALAARLQLERCGASAVAVLGLCTWEDSDLPSFRSGVTHGGATSTERLGACITPRAVPRAIPREKPAAE